MTKGRLESEVKAGVHAYLSLRQDLFFWRANVGGAKFGAYYVEFGKKGQFDFQGVQAQVYWDKDGERRIVGRFFGVETKREIGGVLSDDQKDWAATVESAGGLAVVTRDVDTVAQALGPELARVTKMPSRRIYPK